jgi:hypothetical protein
MINGFDLSNSPPPKIIGIKIKECEKIFNGLVDSGSSNTFMSEKSFQALDKKFRAVNKLILDEPTSIPKMDDIIDKLSGNSIFSEMDLK